MTTELRVSSQSCVYLKYRELTHSQGNLESSIELEEKESQQGQRELLLDLEKAVLIRVR